MRAPPIPIVLCVDVEPFRRQVEEPAEPHWHGTSETFALLDVQRPALAEATGAPVRFSWFWRADPQIEEVYGKADWGLARYRDVVEAAVASGDEHGVHPHPWRRESSGPWFSDVRDHRWIEQCVRLTPGRAAGRTARRVRTSSGRGVVASAVGGS